MISNFLEYLNTSYTAFHAVQNAKSFLIQQGFSPLSERADWSIEKGGKYFVERGDCALIAFCVGKTDLDSFKIVASHTDSPALKIKENPILKTEGYFKLNVEQYGGGIWSTFFDRPLKIAGRIIVDDNGKITTKTIVSDYTLTIPSQAIHINRSVNENNPINVQVDTCPLFALTDNENKLDFLSTLTDEKVLAYDLYLVNSEKAFENGIHGEFVSSPRIDNLSSAYASLTALTETKTEQGVAIAALFDNEEVGNQTPQGSAGDFLESVLRRLSEAFQWKESQYRQALAKSFLVSLDVAHAVHPNHPEKHDPSNRTTLGGGIVIKYNGNTAYVTNGKSSAVMKAIFDQANVRYQTYYCRSDMPCGSTLGRSFVTKVGMLAVDIGLPQLAMHSACECFAKNDYVELEKGLSAFYQTKLNVTDDGISF